MDRNYFGRWAEYWFWFGFSMLVPIRPNGRATATTWDFAKNLSPQKIREYWRKNPFHEVGFIVGDDIIVFDADTPEAVKTLYIIEASHGIHPALIVKTTRGEHHYFRLAPGTYARTTGHGEGPEQAIDIKTGRTMIALPPSGGKEITHQTAKTASELTEIDQCFVDSVFLMIGKPVPRPREPVSKTPLNKANFDNLDNIIKVLQALSPDIEYHRWLRVGMAIFHTTGGSAEGLDLFDAWSSAGRKYRHRREIEIKWRSFNLDMPKPVTIGTLIHIARSEGVNTDALLKEQFEIIETIVIYGGAK